jgi:hypothetical protein
MEMSPALEAPARRRLPMKRGGQAGSRRRKCGHVKKSIRNLFQFRQIRFM